MEKFQHEIPIAFYGDCSKTEKKIEVVQRLGYWSTFYKNCIFFFYFKNECVTCVFVIVSSNFSVKIVYSPIFVQISAMSLD